MKPFSIIKECTYYYCTDTILGWQYIFTSEPFFQIIINSWKYCRENKGLRIHGYVIMPNHIHSIISADKNNLSDILRDYKRFTSKNISSFLQESNNQQLVKYFSQAAKLFTHGDEFTIWQKGSHPIGLYSEKIFQQKLNYMHNNPVRKRYVDQPEHCSKNPTERYSSSRNYLVDAEKLTGGL